MEKIDLKKTVKLTERETCAMLLAAKAIAAIQVEQAEEAARTPLLPPAATQGAVPAVEIKDDDTVEIDYLGQAE